MKNQRRWQLSRRQAVEVATAVVRACATCADPTQPLLSKANSLIRLGIVATAVVRSWKENGEKDKDSEAIKKQ